MHTSTKLSMTTTGAERHLLHILFRIGIFDVLRHLFKNHLTVLNYHRIQELDASPGGLFKPNVSASPRAFCEQMNYVARHYHVVSIDDVVNWLNGKGSLPTFPLLITFDDGYRDNFTVAQPILAKYGFPAVIFLATDYIGKSKPFYWDLAAYCFYNTNLFTANLPVLGSRHWNGLNELEAVLYEWVDALKQVSEHEKILAMSLLPEELQVQIPVDFFQDVMLSWDEVRYLNSVGIKFGAHTVSHPILTRISTEQARIELSESKRCIEKELELPVLSLAYPNGKRNDFDGKIETLSSDAGFAAAFSLIEGPISLQEVRKNPFSIRRIFIGNTDTISRFAAKLSGLGLVKDILFRTKKQMTVRKLLPLFVNYLLVFYFLHLCCKTML